MKNIWKIIELVTFILKLIIDSHEQHTTDSGATQP